MIFDNSILAYFLGPPCVTQYKRRYAPIMFILFLLNYSYMQTYVYRDQNHDLCSIVQKLWCIMRQNAGNWQPSWILAAILLSNSLTLGPKLFSRPLPSNWYLKRNFCIKLKWKHKNTYARPPTIKCVVTEVNSFSVVAFKTLTFHKVVYAVNSTGIFYHKQK